jgi:hypothetical protein
MATAGWIGVDLDGTLAEYHDWIGLTYIGKPIPAMVDRVKRWLSDGYEVRIFTARCSQATTREVGLAIQAVHEWCIQVFGRVLPVTNVKDRDMIELWDDRAVQVERNTGIQIGFSTAGLDRIKVVCAECGVVIPWQPPHRGRPQVYCSSRCSQTTRARRFRQTKKGIA